ncbi:MAG: 3-oxoacyl-ACP synthase [Comamonadaceae bacterium]|nr:MAG: 3-oxoacyl-ACP synthase [Comamonadaceae bacterium]
MNPTVYVQGIGLIGPGVPNWEEGRKQLLGVSPSVAEKTRVPAPQALPAAERRRAGVAVRAALAIGWEALGMAGVSPVGLATVFTSSGGDGVNCHEICATLATDDRAISPTRFHNSVHNAPSGYWSISSKSMAPSSVLCAYDGSFAAGLLEAVAQVGSEQRQVLLLAYDTDYPEPLHGVRPIPDTMGVALLLSPVAGPGSLGQLVLEGDAAFASEPADTLQDPWLEQMRQQIPAARSLPLLQALASGDDRTVLVDYLDDMRLRVRVLPC